MTNSAKRLAATTTLALVLAATGCGSDRQAPAAVAIEATMVKGYLPSAPITRTALERSSYSCQTTPFCTAVEEGGRGIRVTVEPLGEAEFEGIQARSYLRTEEYTRRGEVTFGPLREWLYFADNPFRLVGRTSQGEYTVYDTVSALPTVALVGGPPPLNWVPPISGEFVRGTTYFDKTRSTVLGAATVTWDVRPGDGSFVRACFTFRSQIRESDPYTAARDDCFAVNTAGEITGFRTSYTAAFRDETTYYE